MTDDGGTILALSSGALPSAVAILRLSGPDAFGAAEAVISGSLPKPREAGLRRVVVGEETVDHGLVLVFPAPHSFTGEDVVELQLTGSIAVVEAVQAALLALEGVRAAEAGEFARRALRGGKIDLTELEGLSALIDAETEAQRRQAMMAADGGLRAKAENWRARLVSLRADAEAELDFGEAEADVAERISADAAMAIGTLRADIGAVARYAQVARRIHGGAVIAIVGPPNAGKSTLLNRLAESEAAIVSDVAGTTRDVIEVPMQIAGYRVTLVDTAGLRETEDAIEAEGVRRARMRAGESDLVLDLGESALAAERTIPIHAKADLDRGRGDRLAVSAVTGEGMEELLALLGARLSELLPVEMTAITARQADLLAGLTEELSLAESAADPILRAEHLRVAAHLLSRLTGHEETGEMLDALFARFCVGK